MDAGIFYALLRYEEASLALRTVMRMNLVDRLGDQSFHQTELRIELGLTEQAARTFFGLLVVMEILECMDGAYRVTRRAAACLAEGLATSRRPYLAMGTGDDVDALINLLQGKHSQDALPLYSGENDDHSIMDDTNAAREISLGLSSRARNFAQPLAAALADHAPHAQTLADIGAGSPYVAQACLQVMPQLEKVVLVDRANGMRFAREIAATQNIDIKQMVLHEGDFFHTVPTADAYVLSNTAHDWLPAEYKTILDNIQAANSSDCLICIHEPILTTTWNNDREWHHALWMACYALTLFRLTLGRGTCYSMDEHNKILAGRGFQPSGPPVPTCDGCTAMFYNQAH